MKKFVLALFGGLIIGALSWAVVPIVSDRFEPFDSTSGFYSCQFIMSSIAAYYGYNYRFGLLATLFIGLHTGQNLYAYVFGGSERRNWFLLGLFTTLALLVFPLVAGIVDYIIQRIRKNS